MSVPRSRDNSWGNIQFCDFISGHRTAQLILQYCCSSDWGFLKIDSHILDSLRIDCEPRTKANTHKYLSLVNPPQSTIHSPGVSILPLNQMILQDIWENRQLEQKIATTSQFMFLTKPKLLNFSFF